MLAGDLGRKRLSFRTALLGLFVALTIVLASTTVYESGIRTTVTSTSILSTTLTQTTTITAYTTSSTTLLTGSTTLFSSVGVENSDMTALVANSADGLGLSLQAEPCALLFRGCVGPTNGNLTITVTESNLLTSVNNITEADGWAYPKGSLNPNGGCGPDAPIPVGFAVVQGRYGQENYTAAEALTLYNPNYIYMCTTIGFASPNPAYGFQPLSDAFAIPVGSSLPDHGVASLTFSTDGYWTAGQGNVATTFKTFSNGFYTIIGADEWGNVVFLEFYVS